MNPYRYHARIAALFFVAPTLVSLTGVRAQTPPAISAATAPSTPLAARLDAIIANAPGLQNAIVGVQVKSLTTGQIIYEKTPQYALMPASNEKILTSTTALMRLGPDFRYTTTLFRTGTIDAGGVLHGDLYLKGTGDPSFTSARLKTLADTLQKSGVKRVEGRIIADASRFVDAPLGDGWQGDDEAFYYSAQFSALNCDENIVPLQVVPAPTAGLPAAVTIGGKAAAALGFGSASRDYLGLENTVLTTPATTQPATASVMWNRARGRTIFLVGGTLPQNALPVGEALTIEDPAAFTAYRLADLLPLAGVAYDARRVGKGVVPPDAVSVGVDTSEPLRVLLVHFLKASDNLYGEVLLRTLGAEKGKRGSAEEGVGVIKALLHDANVDTSGLQIADGSGLSRLNHVTPRTLVSLLTYVDQKFPPDVKALWQNALPVGGVDGTLRNRFKNTPAANNLHAKTGTLSGASALSGYVTSKSGERYVFSFLMNHFASAAEARSVQDKLVLALAE